MLKRTAVIFGGVFLALGILGFVPGVTTYAPDVEHGRLFGVLAVDTLHNVVHFLTGAIAVWMGRTGEYASRRYFRVVGIAYAILALLGFGYGNGPVFAVMANNPPDAALHALVALVGLFFGFGRIDRPSGDSGRHHAA